MFTKQLSPQEIAALSPADKIQYDQWIATQPPMPTPNAWDTDWNAASLAHGQKDFMGAATGLSGLAGGLITAGNMSDPANTSVAAGVGGGALSGFSQGAAFGPIGMVGGALFGALKGGLEAGNQRSAFDEEEARKKAQMMKNYTVDPTTMKKGGMTPAMTESDVPIQAEEGELVLLPTGVLADVMATLPHDKMKKNEITDIVPGDTMVFSNDKSKEIDLSKIKDDVVTYAPGNYSEEGNTPMQKITVGDLLGESGKFTPAELADKVRKKYKVKENPRELIEEATNVENARSRVAPLEIIMKLQEGIYDGSEDALPLIFKYGGKVKKMAKGGTPCGPGMVWDPINKQCVDATTIQDIPTDNGHVFANINPVGIGDRTSYNQGNYPLPSSVAMNERRTVPGTPANPLVTPGWENSYQDPRNPVAPLAPLPSKDMPKSVQSLNPYDPTQIVAPSQTTQAPDIFESINGLIKNNRAINEEQYQAQVGQANDLYDRQRMRNLGILGTAAIGNLGLNPKVTANEYSTDYLDQAFPKIKESQINTAVSGTRRGQGRYLDAINESGARGSSISSLLAGFDENAVDQESNIRMKALDSNMRADADKYKIYNEILNKNTNANIDAENETRSNRNSILQSVVGNTVDYIKAAGLLDNENATNVAVARVGKVANDLNLSQAEVDSIHKKVERDLKQAENDRLKSAIEKIAQNAVNGSK